MTWLVHYKDIWKKVVHGFKVESLWWHHRNEEELTCWDFFLNLLFLCSIQTGTKLAARFAKFLQFQNWTPCTCNPAVYTRNLYGFGLTDGEVVERLWAYLRRFARMTQEMRPSHRIDVLTDALLHYSRLSVQRLGKHPSFPGKENCYLLIHARS